MHTAQTECRQESTMRHWNLQIERWLSLLEEEWLISGLFQNTLPCCFSINMESVVFFYFFKVVVKLKILKNLKFDSLGKKNGKILNFEEKLLKNL